MIWEQECPLCIDPCEALVSAFPADRNPVRMCVYEIQSENA